MRARLLVLHVTPATAGLLDQAVAAHQAAQSAFAASAAEAKAQRNSQQLELQQVQRAHAQEKDNRAAAEAAVAKAQQQIESLATNSQSLQQQVLLLSPRRRCPCVSHLLQLSAAQANVRALQDALRNGDVTASTYRQEGAQLQVTGGCVCGVGLEEETRDCVLCRCSWRSCSSAAARLRAP